MRLIYSLILSDFNNTFFAPFPVNFHKLFAPFSNPNLHLKIFSLIMIMMSKNYFFRAGYILLDYKRSEDVLKELNLTISETKIQNCYN